MATDSAKSRYNELKVIREPFLNRGRECSALTIPHILPPDGHDGSTPLPAPYQSLGDRCVKHLSNRLMVGLYPPGMTSFRLGVPADVLAKTGQETLPPDMDRKLALVEQAINREIERSKWRHPTNLALQYLIVTGNALEQMLPDNRIRVYKLSQYVVVRDPTGEVMEIVIEDSIHTAAMPEELAPYASAVTPVNNLIPLYTWIKRTKDKWTVEQWLDDVQIASDGDSSYALDKLPFNVMYWQLDGHYGRGMVEGGLGDWRALDGLSKAMVDGAALASRNITMVRPNAAGGLNLKRRLDKAENGSTIVGNPEDVMMLTFQNVPGLQYASVELQRLAQDLAASYLLGSAMRRDAERVTAYELRMIAEELEGALGGAYSMLAQEMQSRRLNRLIFQMQKEEKLPDWPEGVVEPLILTGLESLGREQDVQRVVQGMQIVGGLPETAHDYVKWNSLLTRAFNGLQLPDSVNSEKEAGAIREQRAKLQMMQQMAGAAGTAAMKQTEEGP